MNVPPRFIKHVSPSGIEYSLAEYRNIFYILRWSVSMEVDRYAIVLPRLDGTWKLICDEKDLSFEFPFKGPEDIIRYSRGYWNSLDDAKKRADIAAIMLFHAEKALSYVKEVGETLDVLGSSIRKVEDATRRLCDKREKLKNRERILDKREARLNEREKDLVQKYGQAIGHRPESTRY